MRVPLTVPLAAAIAAAELALCGCTGHGAPGGAASPRGHAWVAHVNHGDKPGVTYAFDEGPPPLGAVYITAPEGSLERAPSIALPMEDLKVAATTVSFTVTPPGMAPQPTRFHFPGGRSGARAEATLEDSGETLTFERGAFPVGDAPPAHRSARTEYWEGVPESKHGPWGLRFATDGKGTVTSGTVYFFSPAHPADYARAEAVPFTPMCDMFTDLAFEVKRPDGVAWTIFYTIPDPTPGRSMYSAVSIRRSGVGSAARTAERLTLRRVSRPAWAGEIPPRGS